MFRPAGALAAFSSISFTEDVVKARGIPLVISGHIHFARGAARMGRSLLVNAANCGSGKQERSLVNKPLVIDI